MARSLNSKDGGEGHNSGGMIDGAAARRFIDRALNLLHERDGINEDLKEVYAEAKEAGFVTARLRQRVKEERMDPDVLAAQEAYMDALRHALGEFANTPLGVAATTKPRRESKFQGDGSGAGSS